MRGERLGGRESSAILGAASQIAEGFDGLGRQSEDRDLNANAFA
jgi:hypothetical protein